jgi:hypothetical protein
MLQCYSHLQGILGNVPRLMSCHTRTCQVCMCYHITMLGPCNTLHGPSIPLVQTKMHKTWPADDPEVAIAAAV